MPLVEAEQLTGTSRGILQDDPIITLWVNEENGDRYVDVRDLALWIHSEELCERWRKH